VELSPVVAAYFPTAAFQGACFEGPCPLKKYVAIAFGGRVTAWVSRRLAVEGSVEQSPSTREDNIVAGSVRMLLRLTHVGTTWGYVVAGPALVYHRVGAGTTRLGGVVGGGAHVGLARRVAIQAGLEEYRSSLLGEPRWDLFSSLGLSIVLGGADRKTVETRAVPSP
jgi:hypothetical protein